LALTRTVVHRYRIHLEQRHYTPATINLRLAAVRRVAYETAGAGLLAVNDTQGLSPNRQGEQGPSKGQAPTGSSALRDNCAVISASRWRSPTLACLAFS
jgi:hypothetical protein